MNEKDRIDNPSAFPVGNADECFGMSLRDYFAAKAMQGELSSQSQELGYYPNDKEHMELLAYKSYKAADSMLKARVNPNDK
ncbi:MAG: hypothetical protein IH795_00785 [Bacteroidetes bacterium]|nr:hypothetical protein [Bacteroidota bacterium]